MKNMGKCSQTVINPVSIIKSVGLAGAIYTPFFLVSLLIPPAFEPIYVAIGFLVFVFGIITVVLTYAFNIRMSAYALLGMFAVQLVVISIRAWAVILPINGLWISALLISFTLSWILPFVRPKLSGFIWQELTSPHTTIGRFLLWLCILIAPTAGGIGASFGMYSARHGNNAFIYLVISVLSTVLSMISSLIFSQQLHEQILTEKLESDK